METICGISLAWGAAFVFSHSLVSWGLPLISNLVALGGVLLGMAALAAGRGPRTASNDLYHHIMLALMGASVIVMTFSRWSRLANKPCISAPNEFNLLISQILTARQ